MNHWLRYPFFLLVVRPLMMVLLGTNVRRQELLPECGPAIIVANHNSHLDVFALMNVLGMDRLKCTRPVAAADYFLTRPLRRWFATRIVGIIPIDRKNIKREKGKHPLDPISDAIESGCIVLLFPEGSRGEPEQMAAFQSGVAHLAKRHPDIPITPVFLHGLGKALPKGEALLVPFFCDMFVGKSIDGSLPKQELMGKLEECMQSLSDELPQEVWD
ncbi:1-acyl-sn-glycerol-3-phosphate acyltransferase [Rubripirellula amarantea]|uniref:2-acyl-glycerophospho-ethanolamine acyltransferase n=1 Tax=Rubripirellula amarantea TaxID=2527999 RepID=A0A5C5WR15_9BACT|nr:lysophospholipid acyltransferase family protein [Rubripirellula amarantea]MDA8746007.1 1-acyl-sn-glycerol-3-phosphate acyltransferase [Rubripirellula amarantea]TWT52910.1 2-acyl-glycerophospho-ethanolamine acyltransferase [Rubripirellula amarantea]